MKYRYIQIFSFLVALLSFSIFSACEVDDKINFVPVPVDNPSSQLKAMPFSISASKQVYFSKGNLQYTQSTDTWSFAESQLDYIGTDNVTGGSVSSTPSVGNSKRGTALEDKIDLFGWSTSATNFGVSRLTNSNDYLGTFVDWGTNQIGAYAPNIWRTLSNDEWEYLLNTRNNASSLRGVAHVNGVNGLILLPDSWTCPEGVTFYSGFPSVYVSRYSANQIFTADQWSKLEAAGAVFLPASGYRDGSSVDGVQYGCYYWSATEYDSLYAYYVYSYSDAAGMAYNFRNCGRSVRLVKDLNTENGYGYVDLGLSVKWATCNVGANSPEEYGDYFAWGETEPKSIYDWSTYKWCNGSYDTQTKYNTSSSYGTVDNKTTLELSDDAARANWGGNWRMPTDVELTELRENCTWTWTTQNGVYGYKVTSKSNGNSIFLPVAGYRDGSSLYGVGSGGYYWSSSLYADYPSYAYVLNFYSYGVYWNGLPRYYGFSVRPVCQ